MQQKAAVKPLQTPVFDAIEDDSFTLNAVEIDSELTDLTNATEAEAEVEIETGSDLAPYEQAEFADETTTAIPDFIPNTNPENINQVLTVLENNDPDVESELRLFADDNESMQDSNELVELIFSFSGDCWIKITDATGNDIAYGVKKAGRVMPVIGQAPFSVILGAPRSVNVQYDGEPIDISFLPSDRTGRFVLPLQD